MASLEFLALASFLSIKMEGDPYWAGLGASTERGGG
jgi:hypothetical protein